MRKLIFMRALIIAAFIELVTLVFSFGLDLQSTRDTGSMVAPLTFGLRIHHGYIGVLLIAISIVFFRVQPRIYLWLVPIGLGLFISDMFHHFVVLYLTTGEPHFDLLYPGFGTET